MKKLTLIFCLFCLFHALGFAQSRAVIQEISGKVEIKSPQLGWLPAREGTTVSLGTVISTGFNSRAVLDLGRSVLRVDPLTRLRIDELIERGGTVTTDLFLRVGKVNAEIKSTSGVIQNFKLRSPVSTAAVRGTGFDYSGYDLYVYDGDVTYENLTGQDRTYGVGEGGKTSGTDTPSDSGGSKESGSTVNPQVAGAGGASSGGLSFNTGLGSTGSVTVTVIVPPPPID
jgi:hypothetical protein